MNDTVPGIPATTLGLGCALVLGLVGLIIMIRNR